MGDTTELASVSIADIVGRGAASHIDDDLLLFDDPAEIPMPARACRINDIIIGLSLGGSSTYTANTVEYTVNEGDAIIIPYGQVIERYRPQPGAKGICIMMSRGFFNEFVNDIHEMSLLILFSRSHPVFTLEEGERRNVAGYFSLIKEKVDEQYALGRTTVITRRPDWAAAVILPRWAWTTALATATGSSKPKAIPQLSWNLSLMTSCVLSVKAMRASVFLTTRYSPPALRRLTRRFVSSSTVMPLKSVTTAKEAVEAFALIASMTAAFSDLFT